MLLEAGQSEETQLLGWVDGFTKPAGKSVQGACESHKTIQVEYHGKNVEYYSIVLVNDQTKTTGFRISIISSGFIV